MKEVSFLNCATEVIATKPILLVHDGYVNMVLPIAYTLSKVRKKIVDTFRRRHLNP